MEQTDQSFSTCAVRLGSTRNPGSYVRGAPRLNPQSRRELSLIVLEFSAKVSEACSILQHQLGFLTATKAT
jgi:hypothetical protein